MNTYRFFITAIALTALLSFGGVALAHHSHGNYQLTTEIQVQGIVTEFHFANPHVWVFIDSENENGELESWALEGGGVSGFRNAGWDRIAAGDNITVKCSPTRYGDNGCFIGGIQINSSNNATAVGNTSWVNISYPDQYFKANFPHVPAIRKKPYLSEYGGTFPSTVYEAQDGESYYSVTVVDFSEAKEVYAALADEIKVAGGHNFWLFTQMGAISHAARQFRLRGGEVTYDAWHTVDFHDGHQIFLANSDNTRTYAGIYRHADQLYILEATVPADASSPAIFQQSLNILDEEGNRVRYELQPDHTRVRVEAD